MLDRTPARVIRVSAFVGLEQAAGRDAELIDAIRVHAILRCTVEVELETLREKRLDEEPEAD